MAWVRPHLAGANPSGLVAFGFEAQVDWAVAGAAHREAPPGLGTLLGQHDLTVLASLPDATLAPVGSLSLRRVVAGRPVLTGVVVGADLQAACPDAACKVEAIPKENSFQTQGTVWDSMSLLF